MNHIKDNWMIIVFIGSLIVGWTTFNSRLINAETQINKQEVSITDYSRQINTLNANVFIICSSLKLSCIQPK